MPADPAAAGRLAPTRARQRTEAARAARPNHGSSWSSSPVCGDWSRLTAIDMRDDTPPGIAEPDPVTRDGLRYGNGDDERGFVARRERGDVNQGAAAGEKCTLVIERIGGHCHPRKRRAAAWIVDQPCDRQRSRLV